MRMKSVVAAAALAFALSSNADQWFDADIANISSWPAEGWSNTDNTSLNTSLENSAITLDGASNLTYTAPSSTNLNSETIITVTTTMKFTAYEKKDDFPTFPSDGKAGVIVMETDSGLAYYGLAKVGSANTWVLLTGATPTENEAVVVAMSLKGNKVQYKINNVVLTNGDSETWLDVDVVASGDVSVSETVYSGIGEISSLSGATFAWADYLGEADDNGAYKIDDANDLNMLRAGVASGLETTGETFKQTADIDMTGADAFAGIGVYDANPTKGTPFTGTYDGGNFKISNVTMTGRNYGGIFNQVNGGTIKNLTVENISTVATSGEFGYAIVGNAGNGATLENLTAAGSFLSSEKPGTHNMAGIVVRACGGGENGTLIKNCTNNAAIYGAYTKMAGICAIAQHKIDGGAVTFDGCANTGTLTMPSGSTAGRDGLAGILAYVADDTVFEGCSNAGTMTSTLETAKKGQLAGYVYNSKLTLKDAGTLNAQDSTTPRFGGFGNTTVAVAWNPDSSNARINFNDLGNANSKVEIVGVNGAFIALPSTNWGTSGGAVPTILPEIVLSANWTVNNGWSETTTISKLSGTGTLTVNGTGSSGSAIPYTINSLDGFTGTLAGTRSQFTLGDIVVDATPAFGDCLVKLNVGLYEPVLTSATVNGAAPAAPLCRDTLNDVSGVYLTAAQVVADDESTTGYASVENALAAADAAYASTVSVLDTNAEVVEATGWSYDNGVYTTTRVIASLNSTDYPSLAKALAAAHDGDTVTLVAATSEAVTIPAGVTVAVTDDVVFSGKLSGAGAIKYTKAPASFNASWFVNWTGTFVVAWDATNANGTGLQFNTYGVDGSVVEIAGNFTGYAGAGSTVYAQVKPTVKVTGTYTTANGSSSTASVFKKVTGSGTINFAAGDKKYAIDALEDWSGTITCGSANCVLTNIVSGTGSVTYNYSAPQIWVGDDFGGTVTFSVAPGHGPNVSNESECEVVIGYNWSSDADIKWYGGSNSTIVVTSFTGSNTYFPAKEKILSKVRVAEGGTVAINNGWNISLNNFAWTADRVVEIPALKVDGTFSIAYTKTQWNGDSYGAFYVKSLDASGAGSITVGNRFALRIDAVDFAEAPSGTDALVAMTLAGTGDTAGLLYGPNGVAGEQIPVTVNGVATEQTLVYDADQGGLVLYVAPTTVAWVYDENGAELKTFTDDVANVVAVAAQDFLQMGVGESIKFASSIENTEFHAMFLAGCTYDATTFTYTRKHEAAVAKITVGQKDYTFPTLAAAIEAALDGETVVLLDNIAVTEMQCISGKAVTLDLAGFAITAGERSAEAAAAGDDAILCVLHGGSLTINDSSAGGTGAITGNSVFTSAVKMTKKGDTDDTNKATLVVNGGTITGYYYGIAGNGLAGRGNTEVTINGGSVYGTCVNDSVAIFQPQLGTLTINGGYLEGAMGVYVKSGTATVAINGGTIKGNGTYAAYVHSTNGFNNTGDAFVVDNAGYPGGAPAPSILGGTFVSVNASAIASYAKTGLERIVHFADKDAVTITEAKASSEDVFLEKGFPGGEDGKTFTIDSAVQAALAEKIPEGKALTDTVEGTTSGLTYAQAYALGLLDEETGDVEKDVTPTIEVKNGKVVVSLDATAKAGYKVMLNVYEKSSLTAEWPTEPTTSYKLGSETEAAGFTPSVAGAGFYMVGVTIEDAE